MVNNGDIKLHMGEPHETHHLTRGYVLAFEDINVKIDKQEILKDVNGIVKPGEMVAVMGPSGSGKTTLLNCLAGRRIADSGTITLNSKPLTKPLRRRISYVLQEDIFLPMLSCWDSIWYTAMLRLPGSMPVEEKKKRVDEIIEALDMRKCIHTKIGNEFERGLSGGEKKRTTIACELLTNPALMVLDEPTSGLDSSTAYSLCSTIKSFAENLGKTVVLSIHQPSSQIFNMFDKLLLLCDGQVAYYGEASRCAEYFSTELGLPCPPNYNIADHILDQVKGSPEIKSMILDKAKAFLRSDGWISLQETNHNDDKHLHITESGDQKVLELNGTIVDGNAVINPSFEGSSSSMATTEDEYSDDILKYKSEYEAKWPTSFWLQYYILACRTFKLAWPRVLHRWRLIQHVLILIIAVVIWFQIEHKEEMIADQLGLVFFCLTFNGFNSMLDGTASVPKERSVVNKERLGGYYRLSAYLLAKLSVDLPLLLVLPIIVNTVTFWAAGLNSSFLVSVQYVLISCVVICPAHSIGLFYGYLVMEFGLAMTCSNTTMLIVMIAGGFYAPNIPWWADWLKYLSFQTYIYEAVLLLLFSNTDIQCGKTASAYTSCSNVTSAAGNVTMTSPTYIDRRELLEAYTMSADGWRQWHYNAVLIAFSLLMTASTYIMLRFIRKPHIA